MQVLCQPLFYSRRCHLLAEASLSCFPPVKGNRVHYTGGLCLPDFIYSPWFEGVPALTKEELGWDPDPSVPLLFSGLVGLTVSK